ncbi:MFS transporter [Pantoea vagans]|uniref:MFS transporter n=1 Tax=Pantoea vagans TaxID=470934 RepID=UPI003016F526
MGSSRSLPVSFFLLLTGQSVSILGTQVTILAIPLTAINLNNAGPAETGALLACGRAPYLILGLFAGVLVDSFSHKQLLFVANMLMAAALSTLPLGFYWSGHISMAHLYLVAVTVGIGAVVADTTFLSWVPSLVPYSLLTHAQSKLELVQSIATVAGLPFAGWLISRFTSPVAIFVDALSFMFMSLLLLFVPTASSERRVQSGIFKVHPHSRQTQWLGSVLKASVEGVSFILRTPELRAVTFATVTLVFFQSAYSAVFIIYLSEILRLAPGTIGMVTSTAAAGGIIGAMLSQPLVRLLGLGRTLSTSLLACAAGAVITPLHPGVLGACVSQCIMWMGIQIYNVHQVPVRYAMAPKAIYGRVNAGIRTMVWGLAPAGALLGGLCGAYAGLAITLLLAGSAIAFSSLWIFFSRIRNVRGAQLSVSGDEFTSLHQSVSGKKS